MAAILSLVDDGEQPLFSPGGVNSAGHKVLTEPEYATNMQIAQYLENT